MKINFLISYLVIFNLALTLNSYSQKIHIVQNGDTLGKIAQKYKLSVTELKWINSLSSNKIIVGDKLLLSGKEYKVKTGDNLSLLADRYNITVSSIKRANNLRSSKLSVGQKLILPSSKLPTQTKRIRYKVKRGDSLSLLADRYNTTINSIKRTNNLRSSRIRAGQRLVILSNNELPDEELRTVRYKVKKGDTLSLLADRHHTTVRSIKNMNNLRSSRIRVGQRLNIPLGKTNAEQRKELIKVAKNYLGAPYKFGGTSFRTGIDCSAYVKRIYALFDVRLPRTARAIYKKGKWVRKKNLREGDLVFFTTYAKFPSHVGIYIGNNKFIHASSLRNKVTITTLSGYYQERYIGAKRIELGSKKMQIADARNIDNPRNF